jgi:hypothetical protein
MVSYITICIFIASIYIVKWMLRKCSRQSDLVKQFGVMNYNSTTSYVRGTVSFGDGSIEERFLRLSKVSNNVFMGDENYSWLDQVVLVALNKKVLAVTHYDTCASHWDDRVISYCMEQYNLQCLCIDAFPWNDDIVFGKVQHLPSVRLPIGPSTYRCPLGEPCPSGKHGKFRSNRWSCRIERGIWTRKYSFDESVVFTAQLSTCSCLSTFVSSSRISFGCFI